MIELCKVASHNAVLAMPALHLADGRGGQRYN
jgi:hypothetical protein